MKNSNGFYGVLPYIAPEILKGGLATKASDIYSFGIIMWTLSAGIRPFCNRPHDIKLATEIYLGHRPEIIDGTPNVYIQLMSQCWHSDHLKRPTASQLYELLGNWVNTICDEPQQSELSASVRSGNEQFQRQQLRLIRNNNKKVPGPLQISLREYSELVP
ncbi:12503_t:CDS:2 [Funneliformis geosporum]|nr:12503_t:CDS:2 [Funneliformis geosporum]